MKIKIVVLCCLCCLLLAGFGLNVELGKNKVPDSNLIEYQVRTCVVDEYYADEEDGYCVCVTVCGGEYDGHVYEMRTGKSGFHSGQGLEIVFDTRKTSDPTDDVPVNVIKPNMA